MRNLIRLFGLIALVAVIGFSFVACGDAEQGPTGPQGKPGLDGSGGIMVWDSSTPPKRIGAFLERTTSSGTTFTVLLPSGYIVHEINSSTAAISASFIAFQQADQQGDPLVRAADLGISPTQTVWYNPHSSGTYYRLTDNYPNDTVASLTSYYDRSGNPVNESSTQTLHKVQKITSAEVGIPNGLTPPLVLKMAE